MKSIVAERYSPTKTTVRWVKSGTNQELIDCHLSADVLFSNLKGHHPLNLIKPVSAGTGIVN
jgi:hypothetical protein